MFRLRSQSWSTFTPPPQELLALPCGLFLRRRLQSRQHVLHVFSNNASLRRSSANSAAALHSKLECFREAPGDLNQSKSVCRSCLPLGEVSLRRTVIEFLEGIIISNGAATGKITCCSSRPWLLSTITAEPCCCLLRPLKRTAEVLPSRRLNLWILRGLKPLEV